MWLPTLATNRYLIDVIVAIFGHHEPATDALLYHRGSKWPAKLSSLAHLSYSSLKASS